jgi:hypothetical protein
MLCGRKNSAKSMPCGSKNSIRLTIYLISWVIMFIAGYIFQTVMVGIVGPSVPKMPNDNGPLLGIAALGVNLWILSIYRAIRHIRVFYGSGGAEKLKNLSFGRLLFQVTVTYGLVVVCFAYIYFLRMRSTNRYI